MTNINSDPKITEQQVDLNEMQQIVNQKISQSSIIPVELPANDISEIDETFKNAHDFREIGEKITGPIEGILKNSMQMVDSDPIMNVSKQLASINGEVQNVYKEILDNDSAIMKFMKQIPGIGEIAKYIDAKYDEVSFNLKSINGKLENIFSGFDISYNSINKSIDIQKQFLLGIENNIGKVISYNNYLKNKLSNLKNEISSMTDQSQIEKYQMFIRNMEFFTSNLDVLISNLELARKRIVIRLDSGVKLALAMNSSRPIFKILLSSAVIEISSQQAIDASIKSIEVMGNTIDKMSKSLTDKAIESNQKAEKLSSQSILDVNIFVENVEKLKNHFDNIENVRKSIKNETENEKKLLNSANEKLKSIRNNKISDYDELNSNLIK